MKTTLEVLDGSASSTAITRRHALQWLAALGAAVAAGHGRAAVGCPLAAELGAEGVSLLGREYLAAHPNDGEVSILAAQLREAPADDPLAQLRARIQQDFAAARLVNLCGWFVSLTEARMFAALSSCL